MEYRFFKHLKFLSLRIAKGSVVCAEADLRGDVTIGNSTIIHPKVRIFAYGGPIVIGEGCLIEEQTVIINRQVKLKRLCEKMIFYKFVSQNAIKAYFSTRL